MGLIRLTIKKKIIILFLVLFFVILRITFINADSPVPIPEDAAFRTDQGWYSQNAIYRINTGKWFAPFDRNPMIHTALYGFIQFLFFRLFGVQFWVAKLQTIIFSILTILILYLYIKKKDSLKVSIFFLVFVSFNYFFLMYSRVALIEPTVALFSILFFVFWLESTKKLYLSILCGLCLFLAVITKTHGVFLIFFTLISSIFDIFVLKLSYKKIVLRFLIIIATSAILYFIWYFLWIKPNQEILSQYSVYSSRIPTSINLFKHFTYAFIQEYFQMVVFASIRTPLIFGIFIISIFWVFCNLHRNNIQKLKDNPLLVNSIIFVFSGFIFFLLNRYIRPRFFILFFIPMLYIFVKMLFSDKDFLKFDSTKKKVSYFALCFVLVFSILIKYLFSTINAPLFLIIIDIILTVLIFISVYFRNLKMLKYFVIGLYFLIQISSYVYWLSNLHYDTYNSGLKIVQYLENNNDLDEFVFSWNGPTLALEGGFKTLSPQENGDMIENCIKAYKPQYFLITNKQKEYLPHYIKDDMELLTIINYSVQGYYRSKTPELYFYVVDMKIYE